MRSALKTLAAACGVLSLALTEFPPDALAQAKKPVKLDPAAAKELRIADDLQRGGRLDDAVARLKPLVETYTGKPEADEAKKILRECGVGDEMRLFLLDRDVFRSKLKIPEPQILTMAEKILAEVKAEYRTVKPLFQIGFVELHLNDSQARFVKGGGLVTSGGHFSVKDQSIKSGRLEGSVEWFFPRYANTTKDRELSMKGLLYHEFTHYLNALTFSPLGLPQVLEEGTATYLEARLSTEYFQHYRETRREQVEEEARQSLNTIKEFDDFLKMLDASRGFDQGGAMISRWYSLCYAVVDVLCEVEIEGKKGSRERLLEALGRLSSAANSREDARKNPGTKAPKDENAQGGKKSEDKKGKATGKGSGAGKGRASSPSANGRPDAKAVVESLVQEFYAVDLKVFHRELLRHAMANYGKKKKRESEKKAAKKS